MRTRARFVIFVASLSLGASACAATSATFGPATTPTVDPTPTDAAPAGSAASSSASARPDDMPTDGQCEENRTCFGLMDPGEYEVTYFDPPFAFTVTEVGWENLRASGGYVDLLALDSPGDGFQVLQDASPRTAQNTLVPGASNTAESLVTALLERPDLEVSRPATVSVGGLDGWSMDVAVREDAPSAIDGCPTNPCVALAAGRDAAEMPTWTWDAYLWRGAAARLYALAHGDHTVLVLLTSWYADELDEWATRAEGIVETIEFDA